MDACGCAEHVETFWTLAGDIAHWEFEIFLILLFDVVIGAVAWPFVKRYWERHHKHGSDCDEPEKPCGARSNPHVWSKWRVVEATRSYPWGCEQKTSMQARMCDRCGEVESKEI